MNISDVLTHLYPGITFGPMGQCAIDGGTGKIIVWKREEKQPTDAELLAAEPVALAAIEAQAVKVAESTTARDDAKRALTALDTIIAGAPTATTAQMRTAVEQMARIQKHIILATVGR